MRDALEHATNYPDIVPDAEPVPRKLANKGGNPKGDGVHRLFRAGTPTDEQCQAWRRLSYNPLTAMWSYTEYGEQAWLSATSV